MTVANGHKRLTKDSIVPGREVYIERIPLANIVIDPHYQRPIDNPYVSQLVREWDPRAVGLISVSVRKDGFAYPFDGQHRFCAADIRHEPFLIGACHYDLTTQEEALLFMRTNPGHEPNHSDYHRAAVYSGEQIATQLQEIVDRQHLRIWYVREGLVRDDGNYLYCVSALRKLIEWLGPAIVEDALAASIRAWPMGMVGRQARILRGLAHFIALYQESEGFTLDRLHQVLLADFLNPYELIYAANSYERTFKRHGIGIAMSLVNFWNGRYSLHKLSVDQMTTLQAYITAHPRETPQPASPVALARVG